MQPWNSRNGACARQAAGRSRAVTSATRCPACRQVMSRQTLRPNLFSLSRRTGSSCRICPGRCFNCRTGDGAGPGQRYASAHAECLAARYLSQPARGTGRIHPQARPSSLAMSRSARRKMDGCARSPCSPASRTRAVRQESNSILANEEEGCLLVSHYSLLVTLVPNHQLIQHSQQLLVKGLRRKALAPMRSARSRCARIVQTTTGI